MRRTLGKGALLVGALAFALTAAAQNAQWYKPAKADVAVVANFELAQVAAAGTNHFWLKGGTVDASASFYKGLGLAANFTGEHTANTGNGAPLGKIAFMAGPRYTADASKYKLGKLETHAPRVFGEVLFGVARGFDSTFPAGGSAVKTSATSFSLQFGGGADITLHKCFGIRILEADYIQTALPNNAANIQNDFRISAGISYRR